MTDRSFESSSAPSSSAVISSVLALVQWFQLDEQLGIFAANPGPYGRPFGNLAQPNLFATLLVMGLAAVMWMVRAESSPCRSR